MTDPQDCILYDSVYITFWKRQSLERDIKSVIFRTGCEIDSLQRSMVKLGDKGNILYLHSDTFVKTYGIIHLNNYSLRYKLRHKLYLNNHDLKQLKKWYLCSFLLDF